MHTLPCFNPLSSISLWALLKETERMHDQAADESEMLGLTAQPAASFQIPMQPRQVTLLTCSTRTLAGGLSNRSICPFATLKIRLREGVVRREVC
jgi:hypothetical protein